MSTHSIYALSRRDNPDRFYYVGATVDPRGRYPRTFAPIMTILQDDITTKLERERAERRWELRLRDMGHPLENVVPCGQHQALGDRLRLASSKAGRRAHELHPGLAHRLGKLTHALHPDQASRMGQISSRKHPGRAVAAMRRVNRKNSFSAQSRGGRKTSELHPGMARLTGTLSACLRWHATRPRANNSNLCEECQCQH